MTHREDILAQSLFNGLNEERVEKIYALLKEKLNLSNDAKFKDLIDRRFSQICDNLPKLPPADKNKPESSDYKKKGRI